MIESLDFYILFIFLILWLLLFDYLLGLMSDLCIISQDLFYYPLNNYYYFVKNIKLD